MVFVKSLFKNAKGGLSSQMIGLKVKLTDRMQEDLSKEEHRRHRKK